MPIVRFTGSVLPNAVKVFVRNVSRIKWTATERQGTALLDIPIEIAIRIENSIVEVECDVERFRDDPFLIADLWKRALDLAKACVSLLSFASESAVTVVLDTLIKPDGSSSQLVACHRNAQFCTVFSIDAGPLKENPNFNQILNLVLQEPPLFMALEDLITSITLPNHAPINCGRVLDALRNLIAPGVRVPQQWSSLRQTLRCSQDYVTFITNTSIAPRHGDRKFISGDVLNDVTKRTWILMNRYLEFRKRGNQELPEPEFPFLT